MLMVSKVDLAQPHYLYLTTLTSFVRSLSPSLPPPLPLHQAQPPQAPRHQQPLLLLPRVLSLPLPHLPLHLLPHLSLPTHPFLLLRKPRLLHLRWATASSPERLSRARSRT